MGKKLYLLGLNANASESGKKSNKPLASVKTKKGTITFRVNYSDAMLYQKFVVACKKGNKYKIISNARYITNPQALASYKSKGPKASSKKGIQAEELADSLEIGTKHVVLNWTLNSLLNQNAIQEIYPASESDIAVNFIILPEFFDTAFHMIGEEKNYLRDFLISCLRQDNRYGNYLHFQVADVLPIQNLMENMVWTLLNNQPNKRSVNQVTMGLVFLQLIHHTDRLHSDDQSYNQQLIFQVLRYIDENYRDGELTKLAMLMGYDVPWLSRSIKRLLGKTYKELVQQKRLNQAVFLLQSTRLPIADISVAVGYDNTSYFHRIFRKAYHMSPKEYRENSTFSPIS